MEIGTKIAIFKGKEIRKTIHNNEWWFVINDIIESLTDSTDLAQYFKRLKQRDEELAKLTDKGGVQFVPPPMPDFELIFTMLGERSTTEIHRIENSQGVSKLKSDANRGGKVTGNARKNLEKELGRSVVSKKNFKRLEKSNR